MNRINAKFKPHFENTYKTRVYSKKYGRHVRVRVHVACSCGSSFHLRSGSVSEFLLIWNWDELRINRARNGRHVALHPSAGWSLTAPAILNQTKSMSRALIYLKLISKQTQDNLESLSSLKCVLIRTLKQSKCVLKVFLVRGDAGAETCRSTGTSLQYGKSKRMHACTTTSWEQELGLHILPQNVMKLDITAVKTRTALAQWWAGNQWKRTTRGK